MEKSTTERQLATILTRVLFSESQTLAPATMQPMQPQTSGGTLGVRDQHKHDCTELEQQQSLIAFSHNNFHTVLKASLATECRCCGDMTHYDMSIWAFEKVELAF